MFGYLCVALLARVDSSSDESDEEFGIALFNKLHGHENEDK